MLRLSFYIWLGKVRYFPSVDTGPTTGSKPIVLTMVDHSHQLPDQECYTADWKCTMFSTQITIRISRPVHYLVYVKYPIDSTLLLCSALIRDVAARYTYDEMQDNKAALESALAVKRDNIFFNNLVLNFIFSFVLF